MKQPPFAGCSLTLIIVLATTNGFSHRSLIHISDRGSLLSPGATVRASFPVFSITTRLQGTKSDSSSSGSIPRTHPTFESQPLEVASALLSKSPTLDAEQALASLAATCLALLAGDEEAAEALTGGAERKRELIGKAFQAYDVCESGTLSVEEARALFVDLARNIVSDLATPSNDRTEKQQLASYRPSEGSIPGAARAHAKRVLAMDDSGNTIERIAAKLLLMADVDRDGRISLPELANLFDTVHSANVEEKGNNNNNVDTFPQPLMALAGSLQLLPAIEGRDVISAASKATQWNIGVPGDDHTLRRVELIKGQLSIVGLGRSADASTYFLPELGIVFDAGIHVKSLQPKTVLLTHGHRDHIAALPTHAAAKSKLFCPKPIAPLVRRFLLAEAQLNYGDTSQTDEETTSALGEYDIQGVEDGDDILLPREYYQGSPTPIGVEVFRAPHKEGIPAVSYGLYRIKKRLKPEYASLPKSDLGALIQKDIQITESYQEGLLFYTGDTTINLLKERWEEILPKYKHVIHEVTFLGKPSSKLDESARQKGHTHYSQLHPWICSFPETTFVCVHWSLRYSREDLINFFEDEYGGVPKNVVLWV
ncbi:nuclear ribonuclease [Seminavis robusta]|uniref:Nuclear ribonuclease n=1 Tax=Seminavis robusta TaxID=568900 RepID=A0A9N8F1V6_9STRA|nr:nuclear ribonuclease [Seminavis robusta]|eukprot:Sro2702_g335130.1 nuclear ribonuclease (596) ;mRNA; f:8551-10338